jgi:hypothetical protein
VNTFNLNVAGNEEQPLAAQVEHRGVITDSRTNSRVLVPGSLEQLENQTKLSQTGHGLSLVVFRYHLKIFIIKLVKLVAIKCSSKTPRPLGHESRLIN